jgi:hypothetical protein
MWDTVQPLLTASWPLVLVSVGLIFGFRMLSDAIGRR